MKKLGQTRNYTAGISTCMFQSLWACLTVGSKTSVRLKRNICDSMLACCYLKKKKKKSVSGGKGTEKKRMAAVDKVLSLTASKQSSQRTKLSSAS